MEFGARALGNRTLLADPRRTDMRDVINLRIKFREKFRPFAPSILEECVHEWFEIDEPTPYMEKVFPIRPEKRAQIPAVTHVDGSGRLQTVSKRTNPLYHALISRFHEKTGVPIVLNTSLNENEPIVRTPAEAIDCFLRTDMDALVLGSHVIDRARPDFPEGLRKRITHDAPSGNCHSH
jgi:carbamoyltransferase